MRASMEPGQAVRVSLVVYKTVPPQFKATKEPIEELSAMATKQRPHPLYRKFLRVGLVLSPFHSPGKSWAKFAVQITFCLEVRAA